MSIAGPFNSVTAVDNVRMCQVTGNHAADITRILQGLVGKKALIQEGRGRWTRYRLPAEGDSLHNGGHSPHNGRHSPHNGGHSPYNGQADDADMQELITIAAPARKKQRLSPQDMEQLILELCRDRWLSRRKLSSLLQRNAESLRSRFLVPMVEHGLLRLRYPDKPNRTDQAYTAAEMGEGEEE